MIDATDSILMFKKHLRDVGKSKATSESYVQDVEGFMEFLRFAGLEIKSIDAKAMLSYQHYLAEVCQAHHNSIRRSLIGVKQYFRYLELSGQITSSPLEMVAIPDRHDVTPPTLTKDSFTTLQTLVQKQTSVLKCTRDQTILALIGIEGLKISELVQLKQDDLLMGPGIYTLRINGERSRIITLDQKTSGYIASYLEHLDIEKATHPALLNSTALILGFRGKESLTPIPSITRHGVKFLLYDLGAKAQLPHLNSETLRQFAMHHHVQKGLSAEALMNHFGLRRIGNLRIHLNQEALSP